MFVFNLPEFVQFDFRHTKKYMNLKTILADTQIISVSRRGDPEISGIAYDSRKVQPDCLFFALVGVAFDGHDFIEQAIAAGAVAVVCEHIDHAEKYPEITFLKVKDSRLALAHASHNFYLNPSRNIDMVAITGTNGKTTTTFLIRNILQRLGKITGIIGTTGIFIDDEMLPATHTTPESLELAELLGKMCSHNVQNVAMEVSSHALCQHRAAEINFSAALFTNLTQDHLDYHKTMRDYAAAKKILFDNLDESALAIVFNTSEYSEFMLSDCKAKHRYYIGYENNADIVIDNIEIGYSATKFRLTFLHDLADYGSHEFRTKLVGRFNVENAALAVSYLVLSGYKIADVANILQDVSGAPGRMDKFHLKNGAVAIVDYAHTPDALEKALRTCREILPQSGRLYSVFGCGGDRDTSKRPQMGKISTRLADFSIITDDNPRTEEPDAIIRNILQGIKPEDFQKFTVVEPRENAIEHAAKLAREGDIILVAGKGHEDYQIIGNTKHHFSDFEVLAGL